MAKLTRRGLLKQTSIGVATIGVLAAGVTAVKQGEAKVASPATATSAASTAAASDPMVVYVRDATKGEIGILKGEREIVYRDSEVVTRLLKAAP